jgi:hypothetical protein
MTDITPADWVLREAAKRSELSNDTPRQRAILFDTNPSFRALCRAIEAHEAYKQEVSDAVAKAIDHIKDGRSASAAGAIGAFVIPAPKPDPLVDVAARLGWDSDYVPVVRATLDFFDLEIREKGQ